MTQRRAVASWRFSVLNQSNLNSSQFSSDRLMAADKSSVIRVVPCNKALSWKAWISFGYVDFPMRLNAQWEQQFVRLKQISRTLNEARKRQRSYFLKLLD